MRKKCNSVQLSGGWIDFNERCQNWQKWHNLQFWRTVIFVPLPSKTKDGFVDASTEIRAEWQDVCFPFCRSCNMTYKMDSCYTFSISNYSKNFYICQLKLPFKLFSPRNFPWWLFFSFNFLTNSWSRNSWVSFLFIFHTIGSNRGPRRSDWNAVSYFLTVKGSSTVLVKK